MLQRIWCCSQLQSVICADAVAVIRNFSEILLEERLAKQNLSSPFAIDVGLVDEQVTLWVAVFRAVSHQRKEWQSSVGLLIISLDRGEGELEVDVGVVVA